MICVRQATGQGKRNGCWMEKTAIDPQRKGCDMGLSDYFKKVPEMNPDEVRNFLRQHNPEEYNLIDVRQPQEYRKYHLPGALLMPLKELRRNLADIDGSKPTIIY